MDGQDISAYIITEGKGHQSLKGKDKCNPTHTFPATGFRQLRHPTPSASSFLESVFRRKYVAPATLNAPIIPCQCYERLRI